MDVEGSVSMIMVYVIEWAMNLGCEFFLTTPSLGKAFNMTQASLE